MSPNDLSERVKTFLFSHIDSAEQLEILILLYADRSRTWTALGLSNELRSNPNSIAQRLAGLESLRLVSRSTETPPEFRYDPQNAELDETIGDLVKAYRGHRHRVLGIVFSPMKKVRDFADAFQVSPSKGKKEEGDG